jgi:hypothetical protein
MTHSAPTPEVAGTPATTHVVAARGPMPPAIMLLAVFVAVVLVLGVGLAGAAIGRSSRASSPATITVTGSGTVMARPNTIQFNCGVQTTKPTALAAMNANDNRVKALERVLIADGVAKKDIQTSNINVWQNTNRYGAVTGFTVQDTLNVTMHNFKQAGMAIDGAVKAAGNGITFNGITLSLTDDNAQLQLARTRAMHNALSEAASDAKGGGASVGTILRITDQQQTPYQPYPIALNDFAARAAAGVPLEQGTQAVTVQLTVVYELNG